jgi:hypothetical protein
MSTINNGGPAFPLDFTPEDCPAVPTGMTLRDYFATKAMAAIVAGGHSFAGYAELAASAYAIADAMLAAREAQS